MESLTIAIIIFACIAASAIMLAIRMGRRDSRHWKAVEKKQDTEREANKRRRQLDHQLNITNRMFRHLVEHLQNPALTVKTFWHQDVSCIVIQRIVDEYSSPKLLYLIQINFDETDERNTGRINHPGQPSLWFNAKESNGIELINVIIADKSLSQT